MDGLLYENGQLKTTSKLQGGELLMEGPFLRLHHGNGLTLSYKGQLQRRRIRDGL